MSNGYFNNQTRTSLKGGKGLGGTGWLADTAAQDRTERAPRPFKVKPGFNTGVPGKTQSKDRSGGVKRAKVRPAEEGL
jgi:hypothetical protein